jgi:hypothetical protein
MPETRDNGYLDTRIRELVARAVADAPAPPDIDPAALPEVEPPHDHRRRWWIGGGAAILAAAALVTALLLVGDSDDTVMTPATPPTVSPTPAPTAAPTSVPTTSEPTTETVPAGTVVPGVYLTAGPDGVVEHSGRETRVLTAEPMTIALDAGDGRVIVQRAGDTTPLVLADDGALTPLFGRADWDGTVVLHDIEVVDGRRLLLYSLQVAMDDPEAANETLHVIDLDSERATEVAGGIGGWEFGTGRLHLATTGLIVGEFHDGASYAIEILAVPGSPAAAAVPTAADLGLPDNFGDCTDCPHGFTVSPDGGSVAWVDDGQLYELSLERLDVGPAVIARVPSARVASVDLGAAALLTYFDFEPSPSVLVPLDGSDSVELGGTTATFAPVGSDLTEPPPKSTPPASTAPAVLTAGPDGVVEHADGQGRTLTTEPMASALDAGDGRIIVQRHSGRSSVEEWTDEETFPLVLARDGTTSALFGSSVWDGGVVLHDIEVVDDRRLLLFSVQGPLIPQQPNEDLYVIDLDTQERTRVAADIGGWEFGTDRLHLARTGLIVGQASGEANHLIEIQAVPSSPAAEAGLPTPAELGLDDAYFDCSDCPTGFTVAPDGQSIAWVDGRVLTTVALRPQMGEPERIARIPAGYVKDLDLARSAAVVSIFGVPERPPVLVPLEGEDRVALEGTTATFGPAG